MDPKGTTTVARLEALKLAVEAQNGRQSEAIADAAEVFYRFLTRGWGDDMIDDKKVA